MQGNVFIPQIACAWNNINIGCILKWQNKIIIWIKLVAKDPAISFPLAERNGISTGNTCLIKQSSWLNGKYENLCGSREELVLKLRNWTMTKFLQDGDHLPNLCQGKRFHIDSTYVHARPDTAAQVTQANLVASARIERWSGRHLAICIHLQGGLAVISSGLSGQGAGHSLRNSPRLP